MAAPSTLLSELERLRCEYGKGLGERRLALLEALDSRPLSTATQVLRLHETLCFLRAYPDSPEVLRKVEQLLEQFAERPDLGGLRDELADSGVAGTDIYFRFYWVTACWLIEHWPDRLTIDWAEFEHRDELTELLYLLLPYTDTLALDMLEREPREWLASLKRPDETDAAFLIRRFDHLDASPAVRERIFERLDPPFKLAPAADSPSRTRAKHPTPKIVYQRRPLDRRRPKLKKVVPRIRYQCRDAWLQEAQALIGRARESMVTRSRDLDGFSQADERDVRVLRFSGGLELALVGAQPRHRLMLEARYALVMLKNGVPIGYSLINSILNSSEIAFNVFDTFRGADAAHVFACVLAVARRMFGADTFAIDPYQLGHNNPEGLRSGAWWFYYKLGFRPRDPEVKRQVREELARLRSGEIRRSSQSTLQRLSAAYMFFSMGRARRDVIGDADLGAVGGRVSGYLAERFGADRERGIRTCSAEALKIVGLDSMRGFSPDEREAWDRWAPLVRVLPGVETWSSEDRKRLARVVRAKGGRRESDFVGLFDAHAPLREAIRELSRG